MIRAILRFFQKWDIEKRWPSPEASGSLGGNGTWRTYHTGAWS
jgi:hypothetical protein